MTFLAKQLSGAIVGAIQQGLTWAFDGASQADSNPGSAKFRANHATPSSATQIFIHPLALSGVGHLGLLTAQKVPGFLYVEQQDDATRWVLYDITALTVGGAGYQKLQVTINGVPPSGGEIQDGKAISFAFLEGPHPESHTVVSHSDTTATGAELDTLTDGSNADALHAHASPAVAHAATTGKTADDHHAESHTVVSHSDTTATGAELDALTDGSDADALHSHAANVTQTGPQAQNFITGAAGADNGAGVGAAGDDAGLLSGDGGDGTTGGGSGSMASLVSGDGGASSVSGPGGLGGFTVISGGKGGAADGASGDGGAGGDVTIDGGTGGPSAGGSGGNGGDVSMRGGTNNGGLNGQVRIGDTNTREIVTGNVSEKPKLKHQGGLYTPTNDIGSQATAVTPDLAASNVFKTTLTGNATLTFANLSDGQAGYIHVTQDGTGSRTLVKGAGVTMPGGVITLSGGIGATDTLAFVVDGASVRVWVEALAFA